MLRTRVSRPSEPSAVLEPQLDIARETEETRVSVVRGLPHRVSVGLASALLLACSCRSPADAPAPEIVQPKPPVAAPDAASPQAVAMAPAARPEATEAVDAPLPTIELSPGKTRLFDLGPAGPATATRDGVVMVTRDERVLVAKLTSRDVLPIGEATESFFAFGRGPAVLEGFAYWVSKGRLVRRRIGAPSSLEVLAVDARDGTRVQAVRYHGRAAVAYIGKLESDRLVARVWLEGAGNLLLSPAGSSANSVALAEFGGRLWAVFLEARTGMSSLHALRFTFGKGAPTIEEDVVVWVGGTAQPLTEVQLALTQQSLLALLPIERDISTFGLARLALGRAPSVGQLPAWTLYPNGLEPAPLAVARACGESLLALVMPVDARPRASGDLQLRVLDGEGVGGALSVAHARVFANVSLVAANGRVLVSYVADRRTWALLVACSDLKKLAQL